MRNLPTVRDSLRMAGLAFLIVRLAIHDAVGSELRLDEWHQVRNRALECTDDKKLPHAGLGVYHILVDCSRNRGLATQMFAIDKSPASVEPYTGCLFFVNQRFEYGVDNPSFLLPTFTSFPHLKCMNKRIYDWY